MKSTELNLGLTRTLKAVANSRDRRQEQRFPAVLIRLIYSPSSGAVVEDLGQALYDAMVVNMSVGGISFDVEIQMTAGDELFVLVKGADGSPAERLRASVVWQEPLDNGKWRTGLRIVDAEEIADESFEGSVYDIQLGEDVPTGLDVCCPSCERKSRFKLVGMQIVDGDNDQQLPLYDCEHCGTTRSVTSLLAKARQAGSTGGDIAVAD